MYWTSAIDGLNQKVRKTPVMRSTTKLQSAISPSMKDQWSGKILRRFFLAAVARPSRSSAQPTTLPPLLPFRSEEHTSELQSLMRISYAVFCLKQTTGMCTICDQQLSVTRSSEHT